MKSSWNERYAQQEYIYGLEPNVFFRQTLAALKPGKMLLPGEGEGRNASWAARLGWDVDAIDYSESGREKALLLANKLNVSFNYSISELSETGFTPDTYDFIALIFVHFPEHQREIVHQNLIKSLKPGGIILIEAFHKSQLQYNSGGPKNAALLYDANLLIKDFKELDIKELVESTSHLNEGEWHKGPAALVRMIASRKL
ncbi:MAG: class I SAM-dependent methyltransferase [Bacteroidales bacterium]|jgi:2-polyprenyl-3-methyl-5-hydroxy-6-metoxy-1,4-benzoquinol methylase|nr:class I SAM-dependent methyltransferase [Bacteroidales bacterium]